MKQEKITLYTTQKTTQLPHEVFYMTIGLIAAQLTVLVFLFF